MAVIEPFIPAGRLLPSWINGFLELTDKIQSPPLMRKWAAISAIAGALERKVWVRSQGEDLYPNLYVFLVGPPGSGKTRALNSCETIWRDLKTHNIAKVSLTKASLMDELAGAKRTIFHPVETSYNSLLIASKELGALLPGYDPDMLNALVTLYDCHQYDEKRRGNPEPLIIERPVINIIGCCTPSYLLSTMPVTAWDQGFLARVIIIYSDMSDITPLDLMGDRVIDDSALRNALSEDMKHIGARCGRLKFTQAAADALETWNNSGREPRPDHPRLMHYSTRRIMHLLKLCMVVCVDRGSEVIDVVDFDIARDLLVEAETEMPNLFSAMRSGGDAAVIDEAWHYVIKHLAREKRGVPLAMFYRFLNSRLPATSIDKVYQVMLNSKLVFLKMDQNIGAVVVPNQQDY